MSLLYTKTRPVAGGGFQTDIINSAGPDWPASFWTDHGIYSTGRRPCFVNYQGDIYVAGAFSRVLVRHKIDRRMLPAGILPFSGRLAVQYNALTGGSTASGVLAFATLVHKEGDRVLAESDRSNVVDLGPATGNGYDWTFPTTDIDDVDFRVTHIRGYRSVDGAPYRLAFETAFGTATFSENVLTENLTILGPVAGDNEIPPRGVRFMVDFGGRMFYFGTPEHPYRMWWSKPGQPQYVPSGNYTDTWDRLAITGAAKQDTNLIVFQAREAHLVRQFGQEGLNDFVLVKIENSVGCINHFGLVEIHKRLWIPAEDGIWLFDGAFKHLMTDVLPYWVRDYKANQLAFQAGFGYDDRKAKTYVFTTGRDPVQDLGEKTGYTTCGTISYVGSYMDFEPSMGGTQPMPDWELDVYGRRNSAALYNRDGDVLIGSCDGIIRKHDELDPDDDGDVLAKPFLVRFGHQQYQRPGDDIESGKTLTQFWAYVQSEFNAWTLYVLGGDEDAWNQTRPDNFWGFFRAVVAASLRVYSTTIGAVTRVYQALPKTVHVFNPLRVSGRGWTVEIRAVSPVGMKVRGYGGAFEPGPAERPPAEEVMGGAVAEGAVSEGPVAG